MPVGKPYEKCFFKVCLKHYLLSLSLSPLSLSLSLSPPSHLCVVDHVYPLVPDGQGVESEELEDVADPGLEREAAKAHVVADGHGLST